MLSRCILNKTTSFYQRISSRLLSSSFPKNYICDSSVIEAYQTNEQLKAVVDQQQHQFYYHPDQQTKQQPPSVFKPIPTDSHSLKDPHYLTNTTDGKADGSQMSVREFLTVTSWNTKSQGKFPGLLDMEIVSITHGYVSCRLKVREELLAPNGYLHAGSVVTLADTACGYGCIESKPADAKLFTTIELKCNFMGTAKTPAVLTCEARLVHGGRTTQVWDAQVKDSKNKLIAIFRCTELLIY